MSSNHYAEAYLKAFHAGAEVQGGLAFKRALEQLKLDNTPDSLFRIDVLLRQIHTKRAPKFDAFIHDQANQNFLYLLCFYVGTFVGRYSQQQVDWYTYEEFAKLRTPQELQGIPHSFSTSVVCVLTRNGQLSAYYFPLVAMQKIMFDGDAEASVLATANRFMRRVEAPRVLRHPTELPTTTVIDPKTLTVVSDGLYRLGVRVGMQAAYACRTTLEHTALLEPQLVSVALDGKHKVVVMSYNTIDQALQIGHEALQAFDANSIAKILTYVGALELPDILANALILEAHLYAPDVRLILAVPYRAAEHADGFALHTPRVLDCSLGEECMPILSQAFFAGLDKFNPPGLWQQRFVPEVEAAMA